MKKQKIDHPPHYNSGNIEAIDVIEDWGLMSIQRFDDLFMDPDGDALIYKAIERFVKMAKTHRNIADQDKAFIEKAWKEAILDSVEN